MENLYEALNSKVKTNVDEVNKLKEEKRKKLINSQYHEAKIRNRHDVMKMKAYYYYRYFITNILPMLIKEQIKTSYDLTMEEAKQKAFNYELQVTKNGDNIIQFYKIKNLFYIFCANNIVYKEFINYFNAFGLRNGIDITNEVRNSQVYYFDKLTIGDILNAYYGELQRFQYSDELIDSIQAEENTNINGEKLTKNIIKR